MKFLIFFSEAGAACVVIISTNTGGMHVVSPLRN
jgi:hypothetical protein